MKLIISIIVLTFMNQTFADQKVYQNARNFLLRLQEYDRIFKGQFKKSPESCPFPKVDQNELISEIKYLSQNLSLSCKKKHGPSLNTLNATIGELHGLYKESKAKGEEEQDSSEKDDDFFLFKNERLNKMTTLLETLSELSDKVECRDGLIQDNNLQFYSDIVLSFKDLGVLLPGKTGQITQAGSVIIGSTLKILSHYMEKSFNWKSETNLNSFIKLNCQFYSLKREIDRKGMLTIQSNSTKNELNYRIALGKNLLTHIKKIRYYISSQETRSGAIDKLKMAVNKGLKNFMAINEYQEIEKQIRRAKGSSNIEVFGEVLSFLYDKSLTLPKLIDSTDLGTFGRKYKLPSSMKKFDLIIGKSENKDQFMEKYLGNYEELEILLDNYLAPWEWSQVYLLELVNGKKKRNSWKRLIKIPTFKYKILLVKLLKQQRLNQNQIKFLKNLSSGKVFSSDSSRAFNETQVLNSFKSIEGKLFGPLGASFLRYSYGEVEKLFKSLNQKIETFEGVKNQAKGQLCSLEREIKINLKEITSKLHLVKSFMEVNKDIFVKPKNRYKTFLYVPLWQSDQSYLYENYMEFDKAMRFLEKGQVVGNTTGIGELFMLHDDFIQKVGSVQAQAQRIPCGQ